MRRANLIYMQNGDINRLANIFVGRANRCRYAVVDIKIFIVHKHYTRISCMHVVF